jgi:hypothetical protein
MPTSRGRAGGFTRSLGELSQREIATATRSLAHGGLPCLRPLRRRRAGCQLGRCAFFNGARRDCFGRDSSWRVPVFGTANRGSKPPPCPMTRSSGLV